LDIEAVSSFTVTGTASLEFSSLNLSASGMGFVVGICVINFCPECEPSNGTGVLPGTLYQTVPKRSTGHTRRSNGRSAPSRRR
jgi:hypothetical protein